MRIAVLVLSNNVRLEAFADYTHTGIQRRAGFAVYPDLRCADRRHNNHRFIFRPVPAYGTVALVLGDRRLNRRAIRGRSGSAVRPADGAVRQITRCTARKARL